MKVNVFVESNSAGEYSCYVAEPVPYVGLLGYGSSAQEAVDDMLEFYNVEKAALALEGKIIPSLEFCIHITPAAV